MLRLARMQIAGFKSFYDRTEARFPPGLTAVVGPNGCGKSNIGDALNWVLGEQSAKNLRGKQMMDVIFNGSERRKPRGMAEVALHLVNEDPSLPGERKNIVVTRRLFRSGESEYLLNGKRCRLKDVQDLLRSEHVGAKTYATIEQGRIDQILNAKPKERRMIFEDAAGVSGFKHKRRLAELRLEATHANLLRVNDIIGEVSRQINSLKRQAAKARKYQRLREEYRSKERVLFGARSVEMERRLAEVRAREAAALDREAQAAAELATAESALGADRHALDEAERARHAASESLHALELEIDREESAIRHARERSSDAVRAAERADAESESLRVRVDEFATTLADQDEQVEAGRARVERLETALTEKQRALEQATSNLDRMKSEIETARRGLFESMNATSERRNRRRALEEAIERSASDRMRLERERETVRQDLDQLRDATDGLGREADSHRSSAERLASEHDAAERALATTRVRLQEGQERLSRAREREQASSSRLRTLEDVSTRFAGVSDGVRMLLTSGREQGLRTHGVIADFVEAGQDVEGLAETYLAALLPAVILEDAADARQATELLRSEDAGRTTFVCRDQPAGSVAVGTPSNGAAPVPPEVLADPRVRGLLSDRLKLKTAMNGVVKDRIGDAILVDRLETALELHRRHPKVDYLTADGEVVYASGMVAAGGTTRGNSGLLAHNRQVQETTVALEAARGDLGESEGAVAAARVELATLESRVAETRIALEQAGQRRVELDMKAERSRDELDRAVRRTTVLDSELQAVIEDAARIEVELTEVLRAVEEAESNHRALEARLDDDGGRLEGMDAALREAGEEAAKLRETLAGERQGQDAAVRERARLQETLQDVRTRIASLIEEAAAARDRSKEASDVVAATEQELTTHLADRERRVGALKESDASIADRRRDLEGRDDAVRRLRAGLDAVRGDARSLELERSRVDSDREHLEDLSQREIGVGASEAARSSADELADPELDLGELESNVGRLREQIESIGPVNMMAIEEFSDLEERHTFLCAQKDDLDQSMASLRETVRKINRQSRERFLEAFEAIRKNYQDIFKILFNGGRADLRLEDDDDVLECGVEILAQPPGKRLGSVQLMSGGEKAMSAIALLFAIFRYQPSPFCLLDEVDAPLDDTNVARFTRMLTEYAAQTQFIMITHNKVSMDSANLLYGVTMEEPGVSRLVSLQLQ